jgi:hypothetical protein
MLTQELTVIFSHYQVFVKKKFHTYLVMWKYNCKPYFVFLKIFLNLNKSKITFSDTMKFKAVQKMYLNNDKLEYIKTVYF